MARPADRFVLDVPAAPVLSADASAAWLPPLGDATTCPEALQRDFRIYRTWFGYRLQGRAIGPIEAARWLQELCPHAHEPTLIGIAAWLLANHSRWLAAATEAAVIAGAAPWQTRELMQAAAAMAVQGDAAANTDAVLALVEQVKSSGALNRAVPVQSSRS